MGLVSCGATVEDAVAPCPSTLAGTLFEDGFEWAAAGGLEVPVGSWNQVWTQNDGAIEVEHGSGAHVQRGATALRFAGPAGDSDLVKALAEAKGFCIGEGDVVRLSAHFKILSTGSLDNVFLMDLECERCGSQNPGPRLMLKDDGRLRLDRGKLGLGNLGLSEVVVPRGTFFNLAWELSLSGESTGNARVYLDGELVLDVRGANLPPALRLDNFQIGLTASASPDAVDLVVDHVTLSLQSRE